MDGNPNPNQTDLISLKTSEYQNFPGLVLGLDGWILRSIPKELRAQFLNGYEKLLRIIFHPDRYQDNERKLSRQVYLQTVNEAVRFMLGDEFAFDVSVDAVPSKKNPMVTLQQAVAVRDEIISRITEEQERSSKLHSFELRELADLRMQMLKMDRFHDSQHSSNYRMRLAMNRAVSQYPTPVDFRGFQVKGCFLDVTPSDTWTERLGMYSSTSDLSPDTDWNRHWLKDAKHHGRLEERMTRDFHDGSSDNMTVIGAMTITHLSEYIRADHTYPSELLSAAATWESVHKMCGLIADEESYELFRRKMRTYTLPFFCAGMILVIRISQKDPITGLTTRNHRLFVVSSIDAQSNPEAATVRSLDLQMKQVKKEAHLKDQKSKNTISRLRSKILRLEKQLKQSESHGK